MTSAYKAMIIEEFRATGGHPGGEWAGIPMILIHHHGARAGTERGIPLGCRAGVAGPPRIEIAVET